MAALVLVAGCAGPEGGDAPDVTATFATDWSSEDFHYFVTFDPEAPEDVRVVVTEVESGIQQEIDADAMTERAGGKMAVPSALEVHAGKHYRVEAFAGTASIGKRELAAVDVPVGDPWGADVEAEYRASLHTEETIGTASTLVTIDGAVMTIEATPQTLTRRVTGTGTMENDDEAFRMSMDISRYETEEVDDETTEAIMSGSGTWTSADEEASGSGVIHAFRMEFLGRDDKEDADGREHETEKFETAFQMGGTMSIEGEMMQIEMDMRNVTWSRVDTGETIWDRGEQTMTITYAGETFTQTNSSDGPVVAEEEAAPELEDVFDLQGLRPSPLLAGDRFTGEGLEGVEVQYGVEDAPARTVGGVSYAAVKVVGSVTSGATGSDTWTVVRDEPLAGLALAGDTRFEHERGSVRFAVDIVSIA